MKAKKVLLLVANIFVACSVSAAAYMLTDNLEMPSGKKISRSRVVAYRGETVEEPENTVQAAEFASSRGFLVALDALTTADGVVIAASDPSFTKRKWEGDLERFDAGVLAPEKWPNFFRHRGYKISPLEDVMAAAGGASKCIVVIADGNEKTRQRVNELGAREIVNEPIEDVLGPVEAVAAFEKGAERVFSTGAAKLFTQIEGYLARDKVLATLKRSQIAAHAGGRESAPENTMPAFLENQAGGFSVEADLYMSLDGEVFLTHDFWMNRPRSGIYDKLATNVYWKGQLENGDAGWWKGDRWKGTKYCLLKDMLKTIDKDRTIIFDMKDSRIEMLGKIKEVLSVNPHITPSNSIFLCSGRNLQWIRENLPGFRTAGCNLLRKGWMRHCEARDVITIARGEKRPKDGIATWYAPRWDNELLSKELIDIYHSKNIKIDTWTINDPYIALAAFSRGVDIVCTDRPSGMWAEITGVAPIRMNAPESDLNDFFLDGKLDDQVWKEATWHDDFVRLEKHAGLGDFARKTRFAVSCTATEIRIAARCEVPNVEEIKARPECDMWMADNFEIFLSPAATEASYYHFAVSPNCSTPMAEYFEEAGNIQPDHYAPSWRSATAFEDGAWTCEIQIPYTAFYWTRQQDWKEAWKVNFCRTMQNPYELASWSALEKGFHEPANFRIMEGMGMRALGQDGAIKRVAAKISAKVPSGALVGTLEVDVYVPFECDYLIEATPGGSVRKHLTGGSHTVSFPCEFPREGTIRTRAVIYRAGGNITTERTIPVRVEYKPVDVKLFSPAFKNCFYPGQDVSKVEGVVEINCGGTAEVSISGGGVVSQAKRLRNGEKFCFDTSALVQGGEAIVEVKGEKGLKRVVVRRLVPTGHRMSWIVNGNIVVDGKPIFKRDIYSNGYMAGKKFKKLFASELDSFAMTPETARYVSITPEILIGGLERKEAIFDIRPTEEVFRRLDEVIAKNSDKDFFAYYICDEPECRGISPVYLKWIYDYVSEKDPSHLVFSATRAGRTYIDCIDLAETHPYIDPRNTKRGREYTRPLCEIGDSVDQTGALGRSDKVAGFLPTCFAYRWTSLDSDYPTFEEYIVHSWAAIAHGTKTLWPYAGHDIGDRAQLYEGTRYLFTSVKALEKPLMFWKREIVFKTKDSEVAMWTDGKDSLAVMLNYTPRKINVVVPGKGNWREFRGLRKFRGGAKVELEPLETLVICTKDMDRGVERLGEVLHRIAQGEKERLSRDNQLLERYADIKETGTMRANFGGGIYKLVDGARYMTARWDSGKTQNIIDLEFKNGFMPVFNRVIVHGSGIIDALEVWISENGKWRKVDASVKEDGEFVHGLQLGETVSTSKLRLSFPGKKTQTNAIEVYEVELPSVK